MSTRNAHSAACALASVLVVLGVAPQAQAQQRVSPELERRKTAEEECGEDRRCRIDRMERNNIARRRQEYLEAEERVRRYEESLKEKAEKGQERLFKPWTVDFYVSRNAMVGFSGGYAFTPNFKLEGLFTYQSAFISQQTTIAGQPVFFDGNLTMVYVAPMVTYMVVKRGLTPYVTAGLMLGRGTFDSFGFIDGTGGSSAGSGSARVHLAHASLGLDYQFKFGLRARLGGVVRQPILTTVTNNGAYSEPSSEAARDAIAQNERIGFELSFGWAF